MISSRWRSDAEFGISAIRQALAHSRETTLRLVRGHEGCRLAAQVCAAACKFIPAQAGMMLACQDRIGRVAHTSRLLRCVGCTMRGCQHTMTILASASRTVQESAALAIAGATGPGSGWAFTDRAHAKQRHVCANRAHITSTLSDCLLSLQRYLTFLSFVTMFMLGAAK